MNIEVNQIKDEWFRVAVSDFGEYSVSMKKEDYSDLDVGWTVVLNSLFNVLADNGELESLPKEFDAPYYLNKYKEELEHELAKWGK